MISLKYYPETTPVYFNCIIHLIMYGYRQCILSANATVIIRLGASRPRLSIQSAPVLYRNLELLPIENRNDAFECKLEKQLKISHSTCKWLRVLQRYYMEIFPPCFGDKYVACMQVYCIEARGDKSLANLKFNIGSGKILLHLSLCHCVQDIVLKLNMDSW